jgi:hypothetical protein
MTMTKSKAKIPDSLKIGHKTFPIEMAPAIGKFRNLGYVHSKSGDFHLDPNQPMDELVETVIHEGIHVIWDQACLEPGDSEERIVSVTANGLTTLFSRNPDLLKWIQEVQTNER